MCVYNRVCTHAEEVHHLEDLPGQKFNISTQCELMIGGSTFSDECVGSSLILTASYLWVQSKAVIAYLVT